LHFFAQQREHSLLRLFWITLQILLIKDPQTHLEDIWGDHKGNTKRILNESIEKFLLPVARRFVVWRHKSSRYTQGLQRLWNVHLRHGRFRDPTTPTFAPWLTWKSENYNFLSSSWKLASRELRGNDAIPGGRPHTILRVSCLVFAVLERSSS